MKETHEQMITVVGGMFQEAEATEDYDKRQSLRDDAFKYAAEWFKEYTATPTHPPDKHQRDETLKVLGGILYPDRLESLDNLINGIACHYQNLGKGMDLYGRPEEKYTAEYFSKQISQHIARTNQESRIEGMRQAREVVLRRTEIPKGARNPTRDAVVVLGEEIADFINQDIAALESQQAASNE